MPALRSFVPLVGRVLPGLVLGVTPGLASCALFGKSLSKPPVMVEGSWHRQTLLVEPGASPFGMPSLAVDTSGAPFVAVPDRASYWGTQSVALARRDSGGWRVEFPVTGASEQVCTHVGVDGAVHIQRRFLDAPSSVVRWNGDPASSDQVPPCDERSSETRVIERGDVMAQVSLRGDGRSLWHESPDGAPCEVHDASPGTVISVFAAAMNAEGQPEVVLFEHPDGEPEAPGTLRHAQCRAGTWTSTVVEASALVIGVDMAIGERGRVHVAYVVADGQQQRLNYATTAEGAPAMTKGDLRVRPGVEACARLLDGPADAAAASSGDDGAQAQPFASGDAFRCAVLQRSAAVAEQALTYAQSLCERGGALYCAVAGSIHHRLMGAVVVTLQAPDDAGIRWSTEWSGIEPVGGSPDKAAAAELYGRACDADVGHACVLQAALLPIDDPQKKARAVAACEAGSATACALAVAASGGVVEPPTAEHATAVLEQACQAEAPSACNNLDVLRAATAR